MDRPRIVVLVGLPGSGKSTWAERQGDGAVLSSDRLRQLLADDATNQNLHRRVFRVLRYLLRQRLELKRAVTYIDATSLTRRERRPYIKMAELHDCSVEAVVVNTPLEVCLERNRHRDRVVPESVVREMATRLILPTLEEGFSSVSIV